MIKETNAAEHYERTKFDVYKDDICLVLTLTYVLMDNFLSCFSRFSEKVRLMNIVLMHIIIIMKGEFVVANHCN